jgi:hypothetical protein
MSDEVDKYLNKIKKITDVIIEAIDTINVDTTEDDENFVTDILSSGLRKIEKIINNTPYGTFCSYSDYSNIKDGLYKRLSDRPTRNWALQWRKDLMEKREKMNKGISDILGKITS